VRLLIARVRPSAQARRDRPVFVVHLLAPDDSNTVRGLRIVLKFAWRVFRLRCIHVEEVRDTYAESLRQ
jgi:hypothetical protein